ncbi:hypothetical protein Q8F57_039565 [Paraburkholderia terrae]|uniref:hypothetical protein n=1 Tax=Paraburkholderia terrae TaxID=311230 RepID=UPI00296ACE44|nr:hypothetical protein [Paraburkholderia terrae]MDW3658684.1 hypothetical protein [Paraburkholderia terrae]
MKSGLDSADDRQFLFRTATKQHGAVYDKPVQLDCRTIGIRPGMWIYEALARLAAASKLSPISHQNLTASLSVLIPACRHVGAWRYLSAPTREIGRAEARGCFSALEDLLASEMFEQLSDGTKRARASHVRTILAQKIPDAMFAESISQVYKYFHTRFSQGFPPRSTLSESSKPTADPANPLDYPLGTTPHDSIAQLKDREIARMTTDINKLIEGFRGEIEYWDEIRKKMKNIAQCSTTHTAMGLARKFLAGGMQQKELNQIRKLDKRQFASAIIRLTCDPSAPRHHSIVSKRPLGDINNSIIQIIGIAPYKAAGLRAKHIFFLLRCAHNRELVAAYYIILIHTRWNADALRSLPRINITKRRDVYTLQGYKGKTDKYTPAVDITPENKAAYLAIRLVLWNHEQMLKFGHIASDEQQLWLAWNNKAEVHITRQFSSLGVTKKILLEQMDVPWFSDEQIRTHMLTLDQFKSSSGLEPVQQEAGHSSGNTTVHYISQIATILHKKAINFEFQRRLDATVKFALSKEREYFIDKFDKKHVDLKILFPVGDGTGCTNPFEPPVPQWLSSGACDGKNCHTKDGCSNNRIVIGKSRAREIWALSNYYAKNWKRLLNENAEAFSAWHGPAMLFNIALKIYIKSSSYWHLISPIVSDLEADK